MLLGESAVMRAVRQRIEKLATTDLPVAIYGESGTGKELAASMIHAASRRRNGPLVVANCAAMPETLFENELFGHERGSYTGALSTSGGLIEEAAGGTLVLDEIGELPLMLQAKLLRLVQFSTYRRVGGAKHMQAHVRIIAVTNRNLLEASEQQIFRRDLYWSRSTPCGPTTARPTATRGRPRRRSRGWRRRACSSSRPMRRSP